MQTSIFKIRSWRKYSRLLPIYLFLIAASVIVFAQVIHFEFINLDDTVYVMHNKHVRSGLTPGSVKWAFASLEIESWHPLVWLSLMLDYEIYGLNPGGFHLTNLFLHILSTLLLFRVMNRITGYKWRSAFIAAFFAIHPVHVESVAWIAGRKDILSAFFFMLTLCMYVRYTEKPGIKFYCAALFLFGMGIMSKPMLVTTPIILILLDYWPLGRISSTGNINVEGSHSARFPTKGYFLKIPLYQIMEKAPFLLIALVSGMVTLKAQGVQNVVSGSAIHPLASRVANAFVSYTTYILNILTPHDLAAFYPFNENLPIIDITLSIAIFLLLCVAALMSIKRYPFIFVGWGWFVIMLVPVIGIIPFGRHALADRFTYLPSIGVSFVLAWSAPPLIKRSDMRKKLLLPMGVIYLCTLGFSAWTQCGYWKNNMALFSHALNVTENNDLMHYNIAWVYAQKGNFKTAKAHLREALRINPHDDNIFTNLGAVCMHEGDKEKAAHYYNEGLKLNPLSQTLHYNLGKLNEENGNIDQAIEHFERAVSINPNFLGPYENIAAIHLKQGEPEKAINLFLRAVKENPRYERGHYILADYYASNRNYPETIKHLQAVLEINPKNIEGMYNLGIIYAMTNNLSAAQKHLQMALRINPDYDPAKQALSRLP